MCAYLLILIYIFSYPSVKDACVCPCVSGLTHMFMSVELMTGAALTLSEGHVPVLVSSITMAICQLSARRIGS